MDTNHSPEERHCPDCGATLERLDENSFRCPLEQVLWIAYGPKLLLREAVVGQSRLSLELPWESRKAA